MQPLRLLDHVATILPMGHAEPALDQSERLLENDRRQVGEASVMSRRASIRAAVKSVTATRAVLIDWDRTILMPIGYGRGIKKSVQWRMQR
jgi:hypothetical protein